MSQLAPTVDPLPGWRQELQAGFDAKTVDLNTTLITIAGEAKRVPVRQIYVKSSNKVLCCILSEDAADVARRLSGNKRMWGDENLCIMLWPDWSVDLYNRVEKTFA